MESYRSVGGFKPEPLRAYDFVTGEHPVSLYQGPVTAKLPSGEDIFTADGAISVQWLPFPHLVANVLTDTSDLEWTDDRVEIALPLGAGDGRTVAAGARFTRLRRDAPRGLTLQLVEPVVLHAARSEGAAWVQFHLTNWRHFVGHRTTTERRRQGRSTAADRTIVENTEWRATVDAVVGVKDAFLRARDRAGHAVTHVVRLEGRKGALTPEAAVAAAGQLTGTLALASGASVGAFLFTGFDDSDRELWSVWDAPEVEPVTSARALIPDAVGTGPRQLIEVPDLSGLSASYLEFEARDAQVLRRAASWHLQARYSDLDTTMLIAGAGLELLTFHHLVTDKGMSPHKFDSLKAADRLRALLGHCLLSLDVPPLLPGLLRLTSTDGGARSPGLVDGPGCVADFRNGLAHAPTKGRPHVQNPELVAEAVALTQWYFDVALLRLLNYSGAYVPLVSTTGRAERVPWVPETDRNRVNASW